MNIVLAASFFDLGHLLHLAARSAQYLFPFLAQIAWPVITLIVVYLFRPAIGAFINRLFSFKAHGFEVQAGATGEVMAISALENDLGPLLPTGSWSHQVEADINRAVIDANKFSDVYFFSHDLLLCYFSLTTDGDPEMITHTLTCAVDHIEKFGLRGTIFDNALKKILADAHKTDAAGWTPKRRRQESRKLWLIARTIGDGLEKLQLARHASGVATQ